jgi:hypothetical protein
VAKPTAQQLSDIYNEFQRNLKKITDKIPKFDPNLSPTQMLRKLERGKKITQAECKEALRLLGAMDCLYDFGAIHDVYFLDPMTKDIQEKTEDTIESIFAERRLHNWNKLDGLVVAGDVIKKGYNELLPHLRSNFPGVELPQAMVVGKEAKLRRQKRKGKK